MNNNQNPPIDDKSLKPSNQLKENLLEKIQNNEVRMKPKIYFIFKIIFLILIILGILITSAFLISFIIFSIGISGKLFLLGFGFKGFLTFLLLFPWPTLLLEILLLVLLEYILQQFRFGYSKSILYLFGVCFLISIVIGYLISISPLNDFFLKRTEEHLPPPFIGNFYEHIRRPSDRRDVFKGNIVSISGNTFLIQNEERDEKPRKVLSPPQIETLNFLQVGDDVFIAGDWIDNEIHAYGIRKINKKTPLPMRFNKMK